MTKNHYTMKQPRGRRLAWLFAPWLALAGQTCLADDAETRLLAARDAYRAGEQVKLAKLVDSLRGHEFGPWAEYWQIRLRLEANASDGVSDFLRRENGSFLAERLRSDWLKQLGKQQDWSVFEREYPRLVQPDNEVICYDWQARLSMQRDVTALDEARSLWFNGTDLPDSCLPVMDRLVADGRLGVDDIWQRIRRLSEARKPGALRQALKSLPTGDAPDAKSIDTATDNPARFLAKLPAGFWNRRPAREVALLAVQRMAASDPRPAALQWQQIESHFNPVERGYAWGQLAWQAAQRHLPEALDWYDRAGDAPLSDEQLAWRARAALRAGDWTRVGEAVAAMPRDLAAQPAWVYWKARALAAQGKREEATALYQRLSGQTHFYGNLADDELGRPVTLPPKAAAPTQEEMRLVQSLPGLRRALALLRTDLRAEGVREWAWNLRGMNDRLLLATAVLAQQNDIHDRSISSADRTLVQHDFALRYPAPLRAQVEPKALEVGLDPAWVYGLMRQESRFVMDARSSAGAKGLMQLMPSTARWVARKIGLADYHPGRVTETETNVTLGTRYLKMALDGLDGDPVLASAAYNAGPNRARRWRADRPLEAAIYAETIPFAETRDYVKKVMSNSVYYAALFEDRPQSLKSRLRTIRPRDTTDTTPLDLP